MSDALQEFLDDQDEWHNEDYHRATLASGGRLHIPGAADIAAFRAGEKAKLDAERATTRDYRRERAAKIATVFTTSVKAQLAAAGFVKIPGKFTHAKKYQGEQRELEARIGPCPDAAVNPQYDGYQFLATSDGDRYLEQLPIGFAYHNVADAIAAVETKIGEKRLT